LISPVYVDKWAIKPVKNLQIKLNPRKGVSRYKILPNKDVLYETDELEVIVLGAHIKQIPLETSDICSECIFHGDLINFEFCEELCNTINPFHYIYYPKWIG
jgi:hypothetical protein